MPFVPDRRLLDGPSIFFVSGGPTALTFLDTLQFQLLPTRAPREMVVVWSREGIVGVRKVPFYPINIQFGACVVDASIKS